MRIELWKKAEQAREKALEALGHVPAERLPEMLEVLRELRAVQLMLAERVFEELTADDNPYHDPENGQFTNGGLTNGGESDKIKSSEKPEWDKKKAKEPFDYWELSEDKTGFPRRWKPTRFSKSETERHFKDHGKSVNAKTQAEYEQKAIDFLQSPRGKHGDAYVRNNGDVCRYDYDTHEFAVARKDGVIRTYWNLSQTKGEKAANQYWEGQKNG